LLIAATVLSASARMQNKVPLKNNDIINFKKAGIGDDVIILTINSGPTQFSTEPADLVALKNAGVSDVVVAAMLKSRTISNASPTIDLSRVALIRPFDSSVSDADAAGLPDATRIAVIQIMQNNRMFSAFLSPEEAAGKKILVEISADLVDFAPGNMAKRLVVGLGTGRAHAGFNFTVKDSAGNVLLKRTIKETASFWSNSASSSAQRSELPQKVAKSFVEELQKAKLAGVSR